MKIAIIGTGMVGKTLAVKLSEVGYRVFIGTRSVEKTLVNEEPDAYGNLPFKDWYVQHKHITLKTFAKAVKSADIVFNCTPGLLSLDALDMAGTENFDNKLLIDVSNAFDFGNEALPTLKPANTDSLAEQIQRKLPKAKVVKVLNHVNHTLMVNPGLLGEDHHLFMSGNDPEAKKQVLEILQAFGWKPSQVIDLGGITNARAQEMMLILWWRLYEVLGTADFNFQIQKKG